MEDNFAYGGKALVPVCRIPDPSHLCYVDGIPYSVNTPGQVREPLPAFTAQGGWTYFRLEDEGGDGRFFWSGDHMTWVVQFKSGTTIEFGHALGSDRISDAIDFDIDQPTNPPFRWHPARMYDTESIGGVPVNRVLLNWFRLIGGDEHVYLTDIYDTLPSALANTYQSSFTAFENHTHFEYDQPPPIPIPSFRPPVWRSAPQAILSRVDVSSYWKPYGTRRLVRRYWLQHSTADVYSNRSLLSSVQVEGRCPTPDTATTGPDIEQYTGTVSPTSNCPRLPATSYGYEPSFPTFSPISLAGSTTGTQFVFDVNSDGIPDFIQGPVGGPLKVSLVDPAAVKDAIGPAGPLTVTYPTGTWAAPVSYAPSTYYGYNNQPWGRGPFIPGAFLGDGKLNALAPTGVSVTNSGGGSSGGVFLPFANLTPSVSPGGAWSLVSDPTIATLQLWQGAPVTSHDNVWYSYAESPSAIVDVDGDGYPDALTDTPVEYITTNPSPTAYFFQSLRTTTRGVTGLVSPFARTAPNTIGRPLFHDGTSDPTAVLPAAGQYIGAISGPAHPIADLSPTPDLGGFYEDINGDGLQDHALLDVVPYTDPTSGTSTFSVGVRYWLGHGDGTFGSCQDKSNACSPPDRFGDLGTTIPFSGAKDGYLPPIPAPMSVLVHDVTGDGFPDVLVLTPLGATVYVNQHGFDFDGGAPLTAAAWPFPWVYPTTQVFFGDMNGSGVDDIIFVQGGQAFYIDLQSGLLPGLLTSVSNGYGASTSIAYQTTHDLQMSAAATLSPWLRTSPQILHHVVKVSSSNGMPAPLAETRTTEYGYSNPVYDGRDRRFVGFREVTIKADGDASEPSMTTHLSFLSGICEVDGGTSCPANSADRPFLPLRGRVRASDTFDDANHHLNTVHTTYAVQSVATGMDGRHVRFAYPAVRDTYVYDPSASVANAAQSVTLSDAFWSDPGPNISSPLLLYGAQNTTMRLQQTQIRDNFNNETDYADYGRVGRDQVIHYAMTWTLPAGDTTAWQYRVKSQTRDGFGWSDPTIPADWPSSATYDYYPDGQLRTLTRVVQGTMIVERAGGTAFNPPTATAEGASLQTQIFYDPLGNRTRVIGPGGVHCSDLQYDADYQQYPATTLAYRDGCGTSAKVTSATWDPGFGRMRGSVSPANMWTGYSYDSFGRLASVTYANPATGLLQGAPTVSVAYHDGENVGPLRLATVSVADGADPAGPSASTPRRQAWSYADAWGQPLVTIRQADTSAGDAKGWIVEGGVQRSARGSVVRSFAPFWWDGDPGSYPFASGYAAPSAQASYDAFGQVTSTVAIDGTQTSQRTYHTLEEDILDAAQLPGAPRAGAYTKIFRDGHGRVTQTARGVRLPAGIDELRTNATYTAAGLPAVILQSHTADPSSAVRRLAGYDSLGHIVLNYEPNTAVQQGLGWRYAYDNDGNLVGTSDPRGCGENLAYDGLGRLVGEDYVPCTPTQPVHTTPPSNWTNLSPTTATGAETYYAYDAPAGTTTSAMLSGSLFDIYDRAAHTSFAYDARGRPTTVSRQLARPDANSAQPMASNYTPWIFQANFAYDNLNRLTAQTTGADVPGLLGASVGVGGVVSASAVTASYSARGVLTSVAGSYGPILESNILDVDGAPLTAVFGDAAATTVYHNYDGRRRLQELAISRGPVPSWAHSPLNQNPTTPTQAQSVLLDESFGYDVVDNPTSIIDNRKTSQVEWSGGSKPVSRGLSYDDNYRLTRADYTYWVGDGPAGPISGPDEYQSPTVSSLAYPAPAAKSVGTSTNRVSWQTYAYDWLGNTTNTNDDGTAFFERSLGAITNGYAANPPAGPNQLVAASEVSTVGGTLVTSSLSATYDAAGDTTSLLLNIQDPCTANGCAQQYVYEWDEVGNLSRAARWDAAGGTATVDVRYVYDASGHRVLRSSSQNGGASSYNADVFASLRLEDAQWQGSDYERSERTEIAYLVQGGVSYGRVFATRWLRPTTRYTQHVFLEFADSQGSTVAVVDKATGELVERPTYYTYGGVESEYRAPNWPQFSEVYKHTGKDEDTEVGLTYFGARYYSAHLGRWLSPDPLALHAFTGDANLYEYAAGSPLRFVDPDGLEEQTTDSGQPAGAQGDSPQYYVVNGELVACIGKECSNPALDGAPIDVSASFPGFELKSPATPEDAAAAAPRYTGPVFYDRSPPTAPVQISLTPEQEEDVVWQRAFDRALNVYDAAARAQLPPLEQGPTPYQQWETIKAKNVVQIAIGVAAEVPGSGVAGLVGRAAEGAGEEIVTVYRGVADYHPGYAEALEGRATPIGGTATAAEHNLGDTASEFTSWTRDPSWARFYATRGGTPGALMELQVPLSRLVASPDVYGEAEVLIQGPVSGAGVTPVVPFR